MPTFTVTVNARQYAGIMADLEQYYPGRYETSVTRFRGGKARLTIRHDDAADRIFERILMQGVRYNQ